jgi:hypothetical protein
MPIRLNLDGRPGAVSHSGGHVASRRPARPRPRTATPVPPDRMPVATTLGAGTSAARRAKPGSGTSLSRRAIPRLSFHMVCSAPSGAVFRSNRRWLVQRQATIRRPRRIDPERARTPRSVLPLDVRQGDSSSMPPRVCELSLCPVPTVRRTARSCALREYEQSCRPSGGAPISRAGPVAREGASELTRRSRPTHVRKAAALHEVLATRRASVRAQIVAITAACSRVRPWRARPTWPAW